MHIVKLMKCGAVPALAVLMASCSTLPRSGPDDARVAAEATTTLTTPDRKVGIDYALVDISQHVSAYFSVASSDSLVGGFGGGRGGAAPGQPLGVGDVIEIAIFESGSGGLFIPADAGSRPGNFVTLPRQRVDSNGTISVPYAGQIQVSGRTVTDIQRQIEQALQNRAIEPQVVITVIQNRSAEVAVLGDVNEPSKFEINPAGERVLDLIARAGGLATPGIETYVTLERRGRQATVLFDYLVQNPRENIYVSPGDTIYVNRERRTYLAFGAAGLNGRFDFEEADLSLGEALGKAGGLLDGRADPAQVLLYRIEDRKSLQKLGVDVSAFTSNAVPTIFRANLRDPAGFFSVQRFGMKDKDIIYISNADSYELIKFLDIVNSVSRTYSGVATDAADTRAAVEDLTR
jgi:polysaccharide export outer membrane protein